MGVLRGDGGEEMSRRGGEGELMGVLRKKSKRGVWN